MTGIPRQLSLFEESFFQESIQPPSLIVMPTSLIHNWLNELKKFAPLLNVYVHTGSNRLQGVDFEKSILGYQIVLTSYGIVRQDIHFLCNHLFHYIILDESQYIKNPASQIFYAVKQLRSTHKLALTGTPIENSLTDLWSQMDFLNEHILGKHGEFKARFRETNVVNDDEARQILLKIIEPFILRRTKEEVAPELPLLTHETIYCEMDDEQASIDNEEKNRVRNMLMEQTTGDEGRLFASSALSSLTRLRLIANHPAISIPNYEGASAKLEQIITLAEILFSENHKVLIFSSFVKHLQILANHFDDRGWKYSWLTGSTANREAVINQFNSDESIRTFFISLKAGGTGLNLTAADYVFIIDPWWNPASEMQAVSRAHRIGQDKRVTLYRFITKGTIEEKIRRLQQYKTKMTDALIRSRLSMQDIKELLE
jgi:SNF2 family DNA or RNA helicase